MNVEVVVTWMDDFFGRWVRRLGLYWSHCALKYDGRVLETSFFHIHERSWDDFIANKTEYKILQLKDPLPGYLANALIAYAWGNVGKPYNLWWMIKLGLKRASVANTKWAYGSHVCSSFIYSCFNYAGIDILPGCKYITITPDDIAASPLLEEV